VADGFISVGLLAKFLKPVLSAAKFAVNAISKKFLRSLYERSDRLYQQRSVLGARWRPLTQYLEYIIETTNIYDHLNGNKQWIALRKRQDVVTPIDSVTLMVIAHNKGYIEPERIVTGKVDEKPQVFTLHNIPIEEVYIKGEGIYLSYESMTVEVLEIISRHEPLPIHSASSPYFTPTHYSFLNDGYTEKWGYFWNLGLYTGAKVELHKVIRYFFGASLIPVRWRDRTLWDNIRWSICGMLTHPRVLDRIFWTALLFRVIKIDDHGKITSHLRWLSYSSAG